MVTLAICEDIAVVRQELENSVRVYFAEIGCAVKIYSFSSGEQLVLSENDYEIILMDIGLNGIDGMEAARRLRKQNNNGQLIFITANAEYVFDAFDVDALHFLVKPVSQKELWAVLEKALLKIKSNDDGYLLVSQGSLFNKIPYSEVVFCEVIDHKIIIHLSGGNTLEYYGKINALAEELDGRFFQCHRSFIINLAFVASKTEDTAILTTGETVMISRRKRQEFLGRLISFLGNEV